MNNQYIRIWAVTIRTYILILIVILIIAGLIYDFFSPVFIINENIEGLLTSLVQSQATIMSIAIAITLVTIQSSISSYTPKLHDLFRKNPDLWIILLIYSFSIIFGLLTILFHANEQQFVIFYLIMGIYSVIVFPVFILNMFNFLNIFNLSKSLINSLETAAIKSDFGSALQPTYEIIEYSCQRKDISVVVSIFKEMNIKMLISLDELEDRSEQIDLINDYYRYIARCINQAITFCQDVSINPLFDEFFNFNKLETDRYGLLSAHLKTALTEFN